MIKLFTDSTSYIPSDIQLEYDIAVFPLSLILDGRETRETEITDEHFYKLLRKSHKPSKTKPVQVKEMIEAFEKEIQDLHSVLGIFLSSKVSQTYENACAAKAKLLETYPKASITIIDSKSVAMAEGLAVLSAAQAIKSGAWLEDAVNAAKTTIQQTKFLFIPDSMKYIKLAKRLGGAKAALGNALHVTPILCESGGEVGMLETVRGKNNALEKILRIMKDDVKKYGVTNVIVHHIDAFDEAQEVAESAMQIAGIPVSICDIGPVIGANIGPGAIGIVYRMEEEPEEKPDIDTSNN